VALRNKSGCCRWKWWSVRMVKISFVELQKIAQYKAYRAYPAWAKDTIEWLCAISLAITPQGKQDLSII
jgi:hypothetical protein